VIETTLQTPRSVQKEGEEVLQELEQRFPCRPWSRPWRARLSPCSPWRSTVGQRSTCSLGGPHAGAGGCPKEAVTPWKAHIGAGSCQDLRTVERGAHAGAGLLVGLVTPWGDRNPHFLSLCATRREELEKIRSEVEPGNKGGVGERCFKI